MWKKNKIYVVVIIIFTVLVITHVQAGKKQPDEESSLSKGTASYFLDLKNYFGQELSRPDHIPTVKATFGLSDIRTSYFHNGWIGIEGFPLIHPYKTDKIKPINETGSKAAADHDVLPELFAKPKKKSSAWIHLLAELDPKFVVLPENVTALDSTPDTIKVVIMSTPWDVETAASYHPQYMIFADILQAEKNQSECIKCTEKLEVAITSNTHKIYFQQHRFAKKYIPVTFEAVHRYAPDSTSFSSDNFATIVFEENLTLQNISALENGSFWVVHKKDQKKIATLFWIINDQDLINSLDLMTVVPGQKFSNLIRAFGSEEWGETGMSLHNMIHWHKPEIKRESSSNKASHSNSGENLKDKQLQPSSPECLEAYSLLTIDGLIGSKKPDYDMEKNETALHLSDTRDDHFSGEDCIDFFLPFSLTEAQQAFFITSMQREDLVYHPAETNCRSIFQAMANIANYNQLLSLQQPRRNLIAAKRLIHNSHDIAKTLKLALQKLYEKLKNRNSNLSLTDEIITLFTTNSDSGVVLFNTIKKMLTFCNSFLTLSTESCIVGDQCITQMFNLFAFLYGVHINNYTHFEDIVPKHLYSSSPDGNYPLLKDLLKEHITTMSVIRDEQYIVAFYFKEKDCFVYSTWLTCEQAKKIQKTLIHLTQDSTTLLHDISASPRVQSLIAKITGLINIETLQYWVLQGYQEPEE